MNPSKLKARGDSPSLQNHTWVQCESPSCLKWRPVPEGKLDLDKPWTCQMNPDPLLRLCSAPQDPHAQDSELRARRLEVVYSLLPAGSLVLVRANKWPWWPAILSPDPDQRVYVRRTSEGRVEGYHVEFLGKPHTRWWASANTVVPYHAVSSIPKALRGACRRSYAVALKESVEIRELGCVDRLQTCHFKPRDVLHEAQKLMKAIQRMMRLDKCSSADASDQQRQAKQHVCEGRAEEEEGDMLIIEGFRFESATCRKDLTLLRKRSHDEPLC